MIHECDLVALRREANVADPSAALIEHLADRVFQTAVAVDVMHDRQSASGDPSLPSARPPATPAEILRPKAREPAFRRPFPVVRYACRAARPPVRWLGEIGEQIGIAQTQRLGQKGVSHRGEELHRLAVPRGAVDDGLSVWTRSAPEYTVPASKVRRLVRRRRVWAAQ